MTKLVGAAEGGRIGAIDGFTLGVTVGNKYNFFVLWKNNTLPVHFISFDKRSPNHTNTHTRLYTHIHTHKTISTTEI